jgi:hypothetical protein
MTGCRESDPGECTRCGKDLCGWCVIDGWDGEQTVLCKACKTKAAQEAAGPTPAELEALGQLRIPGA